MVWTDSARKLAAISLFASTLAAIFAPAAEARRERIRWTHPEPERVYGFRAFLGGAPGVWSLAIDLPGAQPDETGIYSAVLDGLPDLETLYIELVAYDAAGRSSERSNRLAAPADRDGDGWLNEDDNCPAVANPRQRDDDGDRVGNLCDNCVLAENPRVGFPGPGTRRSGEVLTGGQPDQDGDGFGNACDCDIDQSGSCTAFDLVRVVSAARAGQGFDAGGDLDGSGSFTVNDLNLLVDLLSAPDPEPGRSCTRCPLVCEGPGC